VLSGAYAVLEGAPAIVATVDRYVEADASRTAERVTDEVAEAIRAGDLDRAPWFDATALRASSEEGDRKLGLGSSAAILVASLGAARLGAGAAEEALAELVFLPALRAHRAAQGGGSGVDIAAACFGGVLCCERSGDDGGALAVRPQPLPTGTIIEAWSCPGEASTSAMLRAVAALRDQRDGRYAHWLETARELALAACAADSVEALVRALGGQGQALGELGRAAGVPIVTGAVADLDQLAAASGGCFLPAGAGGGDVAIYVASRPSAAEFRALATRAALRDLALELGVRGVHRASAGSS
jgi:phosphomevalonate kinase